MTGKCDGSCTRRKVGCRTGCAIWAEEEQKKEIRYANQRRYRDASYTAPMAEAGARKLVQAYKQGRAWR